MPTFHRPTRRGVLHAMGSIALGIAAPAIIGRDGTARAAWPADPFQLGVAAGDPVSDGFVLWTRLAPNPLDDDPATPGGMSGGAVPVSWAVARDEGMREIVHQGTVEALPDDAWSVHVEVAGLEPNRPYWYRFTSGAAASRVGRASTSPAEGAVLDRLRVGVVSCSHYELGYFSAYRHLADEQPDLVLFLGDYIYDNALKAEGLTRRHSGGRDATDLPAYRDRYAQYRLDPDLQRLHASAMQLQTWDDHEVQNDYADRWSEKFTDPAEFLKQRAAAYRAFYEHMPVRPGLSHPEGPAMRVYDRFAFGDLVRFHMLDGRQYRSREACYGPPRRGGGHPESNRSCPERLDEARSMLGLEQEAWLFQGLAQQGARWNILGQDVLMAAFRQPLDGTALPADPMGAGRDDVGHWTDGWDGYPAGRTRLLRHIEQARTSNPVVLGGDAHSFWVTDLKTDYDAPQARTVATEFVGTSITSNGPDYQRFSSLLPDNPHVRFFESRKRGYMMMDLSHKRLENRFRVISDVKDPQATLSTLATFVVEDGRAGAIPA